MPMLVQTMWLLRRDLGPILPLCLGRARLPVLEGAEIRIGKLPVVLRLRGGPDEPENRGKDSAEQSLDGEHVRPPQRDWNMENRFDGFHHLAPPPQHRGQVQGSTATISTSYFGARSTFSSPSDL